MRLLIAAALASVLVAGCGSGSSTPLPTTPTDTAVGTLTRTTPDLPLPAGPAAPRGETFAGIGCESMEVAEQHIHSGLIILLGGERLTIPANIGIEVDRQCLYWLHTHAPTGVLHVEEPDVARVFTLGEFFAIWGYALGPDSLLGLATRVYTFVDGESVTGEPGAIELHDGQTIILSDQATLPDPPPAVDFAEMS